jgi:glycosidase
MEVTPTVHHKAGLPYVFGSPDGTVNVVFLTSVHQDISEVSLTWGDLYDTTTGDWLTGEWNTNSVEMKSSGSDGSFRFWRARVNPPHRRLRYYFGLRLRRSTDDQRGKYFRVCEKGTFSEEDDRLPMPDDSFSLPYVQYDDDLEAPAWSRKMVWYQIFPERFCNGDPTLDGPETIKPWGSKEPSRTNFFGGDLAGIRQKMDYLEDLGVNGLYLTPIFEAPTNHKYDTVDYLKIDPHFGTNEDFKELVAQAHGLGLKVMLDAVMNHLGRDHPFFKDLIEKGRASQYWNWFHCKETPDKGENGLGFTYEMFGFEKLMPKLNTRNPKVRDYLTEVGRYWIENFDIDAWRLDVANEVDHKFWRNFRQQLEYKKNPTSFKRQKKSSSKDAESMEDDRIFILGEVWHDALPWLDGSQFHSVMNYPLYSLITRFFAQDKIDSESFKKAIVRIMHLYPTQITGVLFNIIGSHDTPRALTVASGNLMKLRMMFLFQFAFPGVPSIYYGDEIAMEGAGDPGCRRCMQWDTLTESQLKNKAFVKRLIASRQQEEAFSSPYFLFLDAINARIAGASPAPLQPDDRAVPTPSRHQRDVIAFKKSRSANYDPTLSNGDLLFLMNNSPVPLSVPLDSSLLADPSLQLVPLLKKKPTHNVALPVELTVKPFGFVVLKVEAP